MSPTLYTVVDVYAVPVLLHAVISEDMSSILHTAAPSVDSDIVIIVHERLLM